MGRSKFPGKPSKHVNRKRINVFPPLTKQNNSNIADCNRAMTVESNDETKQQEESSTNENDISNTDASCSSIITTETNHRISRKRRNINKTNTTKLNLVLSNKNSIKTKITSVTQVTRSVKNKITKSSVRTFPVRSLQKVKQTVLNSQKESNNIVGKFILPSRSIHSSRVIKPNKRFITVDLSDQRTFKKRVVNKRQKVKIDEDTSKVVVKPKCLRNDKEKEGNQIGHRRPLLNTTESSSSEQNSCSNGRVVLRQARLQLHNQISSGPEGPFSSNTSNNSSPPGTVTCGVCGAVRFYRFVKQARKFNIYSCESCRKFISKMIKRQTCGKNITVPTLVCHKGQGMCHVPPIVRSQQWKLIRCAYRARCPACWLKMCLRSFQMPVTLKNSLIQLLPKNMQCPETLFNNSLPVISWQPNVDNKTNKDTSINKINESTTLNKRPVRLKNVKTVEKPSGNTSDIKRQKMDLKGPRVKHVCRSASIVLGQPIATFPSTQKNEQDTDKIESSNKLNNIKDTEDNNICENINKENKNLDDNSNNTDFIKKTNEEVVENTNNKILLTKLDNITSKREKNQKNAVPPCFISTENKLNSVGNKKNVSDMPNTISIDFWESYDPEEICRSGFSLMASEPFPMPAICFLCGSAGREELLHCSLCCEPYHTYCLEQSPPRFENNSQKFNWLCPRCTTCSACSQPDRQKINCQKCHQAYHPECFNTKWSSEDKPTVCSKCLLCKSCGTDNITKFVGNLPLCVMCFKLRKKGNFCPVCQKCYDDNDFDSKMMECNKCNKWVHSKCEGLTDEQYQILSLLPESVEFLCCLCSKQLTPDWRKAVEKELKTNFNNVLRLLSKNRTARNMLKLSPLNNNTTSNNMVSAAARKLQFISDNDTKEDDEIIENNETIIKINLNKTDIDINNMKNESKIFLPSMVDIKNKLNSNEYCLVREFNHDMEEVLNVTQSEELIKIYHSILKKVFPWYDPTQTDNIDDDKSIPDSNRINDTTSIINNLYEDDNKDIEISIKVDTRICAFCKGVGDGLYIKESRLLYCGQNEWVHANCALWSSEVYEEIDGSLQNVHSALSRGRLIRCACCKQKGASVGCCFKTCYETYHFPCAQTKKCKFMHDKTVYCPTHDISNCTSNVIISSKDFDISRLVYVELDKKRKKQSEIDKVQFMVGSLTVTNIGKIIPILSDTYEAIVPCGFVCSRLFWSTVEPWKLVSYVITTSIANSQVNVVNLDKNFTVDHSLPKPIVDKKFKEILLWQKDLDKNKSDIVDFEDDEEPQNAADILSPELTNAILEELPHDLLDGISVQDIFPKLMSYEDLLNMDLKTTELTNNEIINSNNEFFKKTNDTDDTIDLDNQNKNSIDLKRNKNDLFPNVDKLNKTRNQQHSCSLTLSCKLDTSITPAIKKRKITPRDNGLYFQLLQVDGTYDSSSSSECGSPIHETEYNLENDIHEEPVTCDRCQCTYRTKASYKRHLETCEVMSTSESDSEFTHNDDINRSGIDGINDNDDNINEICIQGNNLIQDTHKNVQPMVLTTYETFSTYQQSTENTHNNSLVNSQTFVSSESSAKLVSITENTNNFYPSSIQQKTFQPSNIQIDPAVSVSINHTTAAIINQPVNASICDTFQNNQNFTLNDVIETTPIACTQQTQYCDSQNVSLCLNQTPITLNQPTHIEQTPLTINQPHQVTINQPVTVGKTTETLQIQQPLTTINQPVELQTQAVAIHSVPFVQDVTTTPVNYLNSQNQITIDTKMLTGTCPNIINSVVTQTLTVPQSQWLKPVIKPSNNVFTPKTFKNKARPRSLAAKRNKIQENGTIIIPQSNTTMPSVIVQHIPSQNVVPTFIDPIQQQTNQNFQYVTNISPQTVNPQLVQIQPDNNFINFLPGVQPTMIIQQQPRVVTDQLVVDTNGSLAWAAQPIQPVYFGFETIVQNTVMQSQQFLPTTVPGLLTANSSYSATTQVFQTSKLEPVLDVTPNSFLLLNSGQLVNAQPVHISQLSQPPVANVLSIKKHNLVKHNEPIQNCIEITNDNSGFTVDVNNITVPSTVNIDNVVTNNVACTTVHISAVTTTISSSCNTTTNSTIDRLTRFEQKPIVTTSVISNNSNSITLPVAPFVSEQGIPTNVVTPTPKVPNTQTTRPMSRVLPMQTCTTRDIKKIDDKDILLLRDENKNCGTFNKLIEPVTVDKIDIIEDVIIKPPITCNITDTNDISKVENNTPLKLIFQKQSQDGIYKISNNFSPKTSSVQIAPLKPIKSKNIQNTNYIQQITNDKCELNNKIQQQQQTLNLNKSNTTQEKNDTGGNSSSILYTIETQDGFRYSSSSICDLWTKVFEAVQAARAAHNMAPLPSTAFTMINNLQVLGLKTNGLKYLIEQLPGAGKCSKYNPTFHFASSINDTDDDIMMGHMAGAIKCVPYIKRSEPNDMFGWLASKHRKPESSLIDSELLPRRGSITNLPMAMRFRQLKLTSKKSVGVYRSNIHRRGLFCLRDIEPGEMVIEYAGEVIRSILTDKREKYYNSKGIGCYMFRIDDNLVVDATMKGNAARFINHSCDPNCYSKVVEILGHKHIIIFALRRILCGEELTYDYKFPFEEDKIPCTCGARRCRKFLN